jgi:hypothetical protein
MTLKSKELLHSQFLSVWLHPSLQRSHQNRTKSPNLSYWSLVNRIVTVDVSSCRYGWGTSVVAESNTVVASKMGLER